MWCAVHGPPRRGIMNTTRLNEIIDLTTKACPVINDAVAIAQFQWLRTTISGQPPLDSILWVDCYLHKLAVDVALARAHRDEVVSILQEWPSTADGHKITPLSGLPTYVDMTHVLDKHHAFGLLALGQALGFWEVNTPLTYGFASGSPNAANAARTGGYLRVSRWSPTL